MVTLETLFPKSCLQKPQEHLLPTLPLKPRPFAPQHAKMKLKHWHKPMKTPLTEWSQHFKVMWTPTRAILKQLQVHSQQQLKMKRQLAKRNMPSSFLTLQPCKQTKTLTKATLTPLLVLWLPLSLLKRQLCPKKKLALQV